MRRLAWLALALAPAIVSVQKLPAQKLPFNIDGLLKIQRLSDPQISPDGRTVAFSVATPDIVANRSIRSVWSVPLEGGTPRKLVEPAERPRWSPDSKNL